MSPTNKPVLKVDPGSSVEFETCDAFGGQITSPTDKFDTLDWNRINPATGPLYINGAEPGDILSVKIEKIEIAKQGAVVTGKDMGVLGHLLKENSIKIIPIENETALFSENIHLPINKMIGVIGVAPEKEAISCGVPDLHGGNMDCKEIKEGVTLLLPVNVPGGLLALGDLHAVMADGEIGVSGLEVSGKVTVTVDIIKGKKLPLPMIFSENHIMTLASHEDLDQAVDMAVINMVSYLTHEEDLKTDEATMLISLGADVRICQVVDPKKTVRVELPKQYTGK